MKLEIKENWKLLAIPATLVATGLGVGIYFAPTVIPPQPAPQKTATTYWVMGTDAVLTDVWGRTNLTGPWEYLGRTTNMPTGQPVIASFTTTQKVMQFFQVSHPNIPGHYSDHGTWRVNHKMWEEK